MDFNAFIIIGLMPGIGQNKLGIRIFDLKQGIILTFKGLAGDHTHVQRSPAVIYRHLPGYTSFHRRGLFHTVTSEIEIFFA